MTGRFGGSLAEERFPRRPHCGTTHETDQCSKIATQSLQMLRIDLSQSIHQQSGVRAW